MARPPRRAAHRRAGAGLTGQLQHVSSRNAFLLLEGADTESFGGTIRLVPLAAIALISLEYPQAVSI